MFRHIMLHSCVAHTHTHSHILTHTHTHTLPLGSFKRLSARAPKFSLCTQNPAVCVCVCVSSVHVCACLDASLLICGHRWCLSGESVEVVLHVWRWFCMCGGGSS